MKERKLFNKKKLEKQVKEALEIDYKLYKKARIDINRIIGNNTKNPTLITGESLIFTLFKLTCILKFYILSPLWQNRIN
jgi:hypothetical protein